MIVTKQTKIIRDLSLNKTQNSTIYAWFLYSLESPNTGITYFQLFTLKCGDRN